MVALLLALLAARAAPPATLSGFFGVDDAFVLPASLSTRRVDPAATTRALDEAAGRVKALGAGVVRLNTATYPFHSFHGYQRAGAAWEETDGVFRATGKAGLDVAMVLGPWPSRGAALFTPSYLPDRMEDYANYVRHTVRRYDGDGLEDLPGLSRPVVAWEIDSEPDRNHAAKPEGMKGRFDPRKFAAPEEYARLVLATAAAIRDIDGDATIVLGGIDDPASPAGREYLGQVLATPRVLEAVDAVAIHLYVDDAEVAPLLAEVRAVAPGEALWVTEAGIPSRGARGASPDRQGRLLPEVLANLLDEGVERVFWHGLVDPEDPPKDAPEGRHPATGLFEVADRTGRPVVEKPAGFAFRGMATGLGPLRREQVKDAGVEGGRLLAAGKGWLAVTGEPAAPYQAACGVDLLTGKLLVPGKTVRAPAWLMGVEACKKVQ